MTPSSTDSMKSFVPSKIISGGQTGVDRSGLDVAIALGIEHGGWCPAGRLAEDGTIPSCYFLNETESSDYPSRTEQNILDSDATLIIYEGRLKGGTLLTRKICRRNSKNHLVIRLDGDKRESDLANLRDWLCVHQPKTLNVAGPRESGCPGIRDRAFEFLISVFAD